MDHDIENITSRIKQLHTSRDPPREIPFGLHYVTSASQREIPRYLFRVFSDQSAGQNDGQWIKSLAATEGNLTDIFERNDYELAVTLNEHLRWSYKGSLPSPFISWTTSLAFALQYAIYRHKHKREPMDKIQFCVIDTTDFPCRTFVQDLELIEKFQGKVDSNASIETRKGRKPWWFSGLPNMLKLRSWKHEDFSGTCYFGEYLAQGQLCIENRSFVVSCDKILTKDLLNLIPALKANMEDQTSHWVKAVLQLREPFYVPNEARFISKKDITPILKIMGAFTNKWIVVMFTSLLGLYPRRMRDLEFADVPLDLLPDEILDKCLSQKTTISNSVHMPEVVQFGQLLETISDKYALRCVKMLHQYMQQTADVWARIREDVDSSNEAHENVRRSMLAVERMERPVKVVESCAQDVRRTAMMLQGALESLEM